jgi:3-oxoacyl-[acyl-carrier-protein] synthase III
VVAVVKKITGGAVIDDSRTLFSSDHLYMNGAEIFNISLKELLINKGINEKMTVLTTGFDVGYYWGGCVLKV